MRIFYFLQSPTKKYSVFHMLRDIRSTGSVEFMGMRVSYPQYLRLKSIQGQVIRMDKMIRNMLSQHPLSELTGNPHWEELIEMYRIMKKILPAEYLEGHDYVDPMRNARQ